MSTVLGFAASTISTVVNGSGMDVLILMNLDGLTFVFAESQVVVDICAWSHKSHAAVDYTLISVEPHGPTRGVWSIAAVTNDSQSHLVTSSIYGYAQHNPDT